ncbi:MAG: tRNA (guanosine(46)-N7)-methyltransferase TrmB [Flavobacteriales bacterium]|nr:tRNA (guanosine(46)-N7)-methyltransferase TrmB [Flavobacteriales bacterium]
MGKDKLRRWEQMKDYPNVLQPEFCDIFDKDHNLKGKWAKDFFKNDFPITLELGCGKGEYTVAQAKKYGKRNYIGIDIKGARMWKGAGIAIEEGLQNVAFLRTRIEFIKSFFDRDEIDEIWITFPDPQLKDRRIKKRLTAPGFLDNYSSFMKKGGKIRLKTDNLVLAQYTEEVVRADDRFELEKCSFDVYGADWDSFESGLQDLLEVKTFYEQGFLDKGLKINYVSFVVR